MTGQYKKIISICMAVGMLIATTGAKSQEIVLQDDFETGELSSIWMAKNLSEGALRHITTPTRSGKGAITIRLQPGANTAIGGDGQVTEREELREAPGVRLGMGVESWYAFSFFLPADFPIVETRLVMASWKQSFKDPAKDRSPIVSLRYMGGRLIVAVARDRGKRRLFQDPIDLRGQWVDMVFRMIPRTGKDGLLQVWQNGRQIVDYQGALGFKRDENEIYFKLGLYRNHMNRPMRIVYDRFRRGTTYQTVSIPTR